MLQDISAVVDIHFSVMISNHLNQFILCIQYHDDLWLSMCFFPLHSITTIMVISSRRLWVRLDKLTRSNVPRRSSSVCSRSVYRLCLSLTQALWLCLEKWVLSKLFILCFTPVFPLAVQWNAVWTGSWVWPLLVCILWNQRVGPSVFSNLWSRPGQNQRCHRYAAQVRLRSAVVISHCFSFGLASGKWCFEETKTSSVHAYITVFSLLRVCIRPVTYFKRGKYVCTCNPKFAM